MMRHIRLSRGARMILALVMLATLCTPLAVGAEGGWDLRVNRIETVSIEGTQAHMVRARVSLVDGNGQPVQDLNQDNLEAFEDSNPVTIQSIEPLQDPISLVLVVDLSGSMVKFRDKNGNVPFDEIKKAILALKDTLGPDDELALITFSTVVETALDFGLDHNTVINKVNTLQAEGWTCLYDGVYQGIEKSAQRPAGRRAIIVFTDGFDEGEGDKPCSVHTLPQVIERATAEQIQVPIFTVGLESANVAREALSSMAYETGGRTIITPNAAEFTSLFVGTVNQLKHQYLVTYRSDAPSGTRTLALKAKRDTDFADSPTRDFVIDELPNPPELSLSGMAAGQQLADPTEIKAQVQSETTISGIKVFVDGQLNNEQPGNIRDLTIPLDPAQFGAGEHVLKLVVTDALGQADEAVLTFVVQGAVEPTDKPKSAPVVPVESSDDSGDEKTDGLPLGLIIGIGAGLIVLIVGGILLSKRKTEPKSVPTTTTWGPVPGLPAGTGTTTHAEGAPDGTSDVGGYDTTQDVSDSAPIAYLQVETSLDLKSGTRFELLARDYSIGRDSERDIVIPDKPVSRRHALLQLQNGSFVIKDQGSTYGTQVNGRGVGLHGVMLQQGDEVKLGTRTVLSYASLGQNLDTTTDVGTGTAASFDDLNHTTDIG